MEFTKTFCIYRKTKYFSLMQTKASITKNGYTFERSRYNPALDYLIGKELFKEKVDATTAFLIEHGLPKKYYEKDNS